jgi:hypothetical protein
MTPFASVMEWNCMCLFMVNALFVHDSFTGARLQPSSCGRAAVARVRAVPQLRYDAPLLLWLRQPASPARAPPRADLRAARAAGYTLGEFADALAAMAASAPALLCFLALVLVAVPLYGQVQAHRVARTSMRSDPHHQDTRSSERD